MNTPLTKLEREINIISILGCAQCCDGVKRMAADGKAFNHCCCKPLPKPAGNGESR